MCLRLWTRSWSSTTTAPTVRLRWPARLGAVVVTEERKGYGAAYKAGLTHATGDIIITMDGDGTYPRSFIPVLLEIMLEEDWDFITCDRTGHREQGAGTALRILGNSILNWSMALLFFVRLRDSQSGMWVFKRSILPRLVDCQRRHGVLGRAEDRGLHQEGLALHRAADLLSSAYRRE